MHNTKILSRKARRIRRSREEIAALLEAYHSSGLTQRAYAESEGICVATLSNWLRQARLDGGGQDSERPRLVPVRVTDGVGMPLGPQGAYELIFPDGLRLLIPPEFDQASLRRLLPLVSGTC